MKKYKEEITQFKLPQNKQLALLALLKCIIDSLQILPNMQVAEL